MAKLTNLLGEIFQSIFAHKRRSILMGIGISWGIFILIILMGLGLGFEKGVLELFDGMSKKTIYAFCGQTSIPSKGLLSGRNIYLNEEDINNMKVAISGISAISPIVTNWSGSVLEYENNTVRFNTKGIYHDYFKINLLKPKIGRVFNYLDFKNDRKVVILGKTVSDLLFKSKIPVGKYIKIDNNFFLVIGVLNESIIDHNLSRDVYIPYTSYKQIYSKDTKITQIALSLVSNVNDKEIENRIRKYISDIHYFDKSDTYAISFLNIDEQVKSFKQLFEGVKLFLWFIGISTLLSSVIGVGNIMYLLVKERTKEFGVRKAIGAKPYTILIMVLFESVFFTVFAGLVGILLGYLSIGLINSVLAQMDIILKRAYIDFDIVVSSMILLTFFGALAGIMPAIKAAKINPITALKDE